MNERDDAPDSARTTSAAALDGTLVSLAYKWAEAELQRTLTKPPAEEDTYNLFDFVVKPAYDRVDEQEELLRLGEVPKELQPLARDGLAHRREKRDRENRKKAVHSLAEKLGKRSSNRCLPSLDTEKRLVDLYILHQGSLKLIERGKQRTLEAITTNSTGPGALPGMSLTDRIHSACKSIYQEAATRLDGTLVLAVSSAPTPWEVRAKALKELGDSAVQMTKQMIEAARSEISRRQKEASKSSGWSSFLSGLVKRGLDELLGKVTERVPLPLVQTHIMSALDRVQQQEKNEFQRTLWEVDSSITTIACEAGKRIEADLAERGSVAENGDSRTNRVTPVDPLECAQGCPGCKPLHGDKAILPFIANEIGKKKIGRATVNDWLKSDKLKGIPNPFVEGARPREVRPCRLREWLRNRRN